MMDSLIFLDSEIGADGALLEVAALKNRDVFWKGTTTQGWWRDPYREQAPDILVILPRFTFKRQE